MRRSTADLTPLADNDIEDILAWSRKQFGALASRRYAALLRKAIRDAAARSRMQIPPRADLPGNLYTWHLSLSKDQASQPPVGRPRHFLVYRHTRTGIQILRILHDSRDLPAHV